MTERKTLKRRVLSPGVSPLSAACHSPHRPKRNKTSKTNPTKNKIPPKVPQTFLEPFLFVQPGKLRWNSRVMELWFRWFSFFNFRWFLLASKSRKKNVRGCVIMMIYIILTHFHHFHPFSSFLPWKSRKVKQKPNKTDLAQGTTVRC